MAQHDNGRRAAGSQSEPWQRGHQGQADYSSGQQNQYDPGRQQQGDNWRDAGMSRGGSQGGQGSFGGQASDNDYGNRGITESGNFGNYSQRPDQSRGQGGDYDALTGQRSGRAGYGSRGDHDRGGQSAQRFGGGYRHGYDARSDSTGGDWNSGSHGSRASRENQRWHTQDRDAGYGQPSDWGGYQSSREALGQEHYGDGGRQGNWVSGQGGQSYHDPDYHQWRSEQVRQLDRDYDQWRQHRYQRFADEFDEWRSNRDKNPGGDASQRGASTKASDTSSASDNAKSADASSSKNQHK